MAATYNYPFAYIKGAFTRPDYQLNGKSVFFEARKDGVALYTISKKMRNEIEPYKNIPTNFKQVAVNFKTSQLKSIDKLFNKDIPSYGAKAVNFSKLVRLFKYSRHKNAFAIPVGFARKVLDENKHSSGGSVSQFIRAKLNTIKADGIALSQVKSTLEEIQETIKNAKIPKTMLVELKNRLDRDFPSTKVRFRSSSPFEDNEAFNGAGLYTSKSIKPDHSAKEINKDYLKVLASFYNSRAFLARKSFGFKERIGSMGILVHPSYNGELARGVALFKKSSALSNTYEATISGFKGDKLKVVEAPPGVLPEVAEVSNSLRRIYVSIQQETTELPAGQQVLTDDQYKLLFKAMREFFTRQAKQDDTYDFEWKLVKNGSGEAIELKQYRPVPKPDRFPKPKENIYVFDSQLVQKPHFYEVADAIKEFRNDYSIRVLGETLKFRSGIDSGITKIEVTTPAGKMETFKPSEFKAKYSSQRTPRWNIELTLADKTKLALFMMEPHRAKNKKDIRSSGALTFQISTSGLNYPFGLRSITDDTILGSAESEREIKNKFEGPVGGANLVINTSGFTKFGGYDKTMHLRMHGIEIDGLIAGQPLVISNERAIKYSPAHHNFYWEFGIDLDLIKPSLPHANALKAWLKKLNAQDGRYVIFGYPRNNEVPEGEDHWKYARDHSLFRIYDKTGKVELFKTTIRPIHQ